MQNKGYFVQLLSPFNLWEDYNYHSYNNQDDAIKDMNYLDASYDLKKDWRVIEREVVIKNSYLAGSLKLDREEQALRDVSIERQWED